MLKYLTIKGGLYKKQGDLTVKEQVLLRIWLYFFLSSLAANKSFTVLL